jgi:hypothetical protein
MDDSNGKAIETEIREDSEIEEGSEATDNHSAEEVIDFLLVLALTIAGATAIAKGLQALGFKGFGLLSSLLKRFDF